VQTGTTYLDSVKKLPGVKEVKNFPQDNNARPRCRAAAWTPG
jgi:polar amino acid transport system substrate-binding protein